MSSLTNKYSSSSIKKHRIFIKRDKKIKMHRFFVFIDEKTTFFGLHIGRDRDPFSLMVK